MIRPHGSSPPQSQTFCPPTGCPITTRNGCPVGPPGGAVFEGECAYIDDTASATVLLVDQRRSAGYRNRWRSRAIVNVDLHCSRRRRCLAVTVRHSNEERSPARTPAPW